MVAAAAAAESLQLCPTLCDPIDGSPPGSAVPGILLARTLEWVAISFSNAMHACYLMPFHNSIRSFKKYVKQRLSLINLIASAIVIPEKAMAPHSSTLAWKIPWTEEPGGLQSMGSLESDTTE